ncbi:hypothetical protein Thiowin_02840 [Thiorhodovibrio winogradskyi]|uniref:Uncharacterized protein n=1 Tax=Thiorhodovibrio winogradskyi TaxID=77007 RepID=A0ABZ0S9T6_9GAMM|nr:hypothetical protein [Thiorhodovibrio winogradskyi]
MNPKPKCATHARFSATAAITMADMVMAQNVLEKDEEHRVSFGPRPPPRSSDSPFALKKNYTITPGEKL